MQNNPKLMPTTELEASTRLARENLARLKAQQAAGVERGPPMATSLMDLAAPAEAPEQFRSGAV